MNKRLFLLINLILISTLVLANCGPVTQVPISTPTVLPTETIPDVEVQEDQVAPSIVEQVPSAGQRLDPSSDLRLVFDRDMDPKKTGDAFRLLDPNNETVSGKVTWLDPKTFTFAPDTRLEPAKVYQAIFSTSASGADGKPLLDEFRLEFTTTEALAVSQVFPIHDSEDVDSTTNITVIFNQPVVPCASRKNRATCLSPWSFHLR